MRLLCTAGCALLVLAAGSSPPHTSHVAPPEADGECGAPKAGWIWCDDFEEDRTGQYFEHTKKQQFVRDSGVGVDGSWGMRARFRAGQVEGGALHLAFGKTPDPHFRPVDDGTAVYREIYWRVYVRNQPGWIGGGGAKLSRATSFISPKWQQAMIAHVWAGSAPAMRTRLFVEPASGTDPAGTIRTTRYNDFKNLRWLGPKGSGTAIFDAAHVGRWHCIESRVRLNDPGQSNGVQELWINDRLEASRPGLNFVGRFTAYGVNAVFLENYWNGGSPAAQERYFDRFVVSTQRIGC